jgi:hypothetical protein
MNTEMHYKAKEYWNDLSKDKRTEILLQYNFWLGFSDYLYEYIPEDLKSLIVLKIDINDQLGS